MQRLAISALLALLAGVGAAEAGPCTAEIATAQANFDARAKELAVIGPSLTETTGAKLHRQPTAASVAGAEQSADMMSLEKQKAFQDAIARARTADKAGNADACQKDLADVRAALAH